MDNLRQDYIVKGKGKNPSPKCQIKIETEGVFKGLEKLNSSVIKKVKCPNLAVVEIKVLVGFEKCGVGKKLRMCNDHFEKAVKNYFNFVSGDDLEWAFNQYAKKIKGLFDGTV